MLELSGSRYMIRGLGYLKSLADLENVPVMAKNGTPVLIKDLGRVSFGPDMREGVAEWQGEGETVGGIVVMRYGLNALTVIDGVKKKLEEIKGSLPPGVEVVSGYDRASLIQESIKTLQRDLIEEAIIVSLVIIVFLFHFRSALIPIITLPIAVVASFIPMYYLHVSSNIMSLGGLALAIGVLVDAAIVMVENGYRHLSENRPANEADRRLVLSDAAKQVGPALFFSLVIEEKPTASVSKRKRDECLSTGIGSDVMKPIAAPIVGGMITSTIHVLILVPVFFALMKERALRRGTLQPKELGSAAVQFADYD